MTILNMTSENLPTDMRMNNFCVVLTDLDDMIGECICHNADDSYTIWINSRWSSEEQRKCFLHALDHVRHNDWEKTSADEIERERHENGDLLSGFDRPTGS